VKILAGIAIGVVLVVGIAAYLFVKNGPMGGR
jgi:hypothetical protein